MDKSRSRSLEDEADQYGEVFIDERPVTIPTIPSDKTVHILGVGSVGIFLAHALRTTQQPPNVTLMFYKPSALRDFLTAKRKIQVKYMGGEEESTDYDVELALPLYASRGNEVVEPARARANTVEKFSEFVKEDHIAYLVVTVKAHHTLAALQPLIHRLDRTSTICLLQNGMGTYEEVVRRLWPDEKSRPNFVLGINSHGMHQQGRFSVVHAGRGIMTFGLVPRKPATSKGTSSTKQESQPESTESQTQAHPQPQNEASDKAQGKSIPRAQATDQLKEADFEEWPSSARWLTQTLTRIPLLAAIAVHPLELRQLQLEKLAVNSVINPLTCLLDCRNGQLLSNHALTRTWRLLLAETSAIISSLPELKEMPLVEERFAPARLETLTLGVARRTGKNLSSMLQDMRRGVETEIEYINGYVVRRGEELGYKAVVNYAVMQMVKGKQNLVSREVDDYVPNRDEPGFGGWTKN